MLVTQINVFNAVHLNALFNRTSTTSFPSFEISFLINPPHDMIGSSIYSFLFHSPIEKHSVNVFNTVRSNRFARCTYRIRFIRVITLTVVCRALRICWSGSVSCLLMTPFMCIPSCLRSYKNRLCLINLQSYTDSSFGHVKQKQRL